MRNALLGLTLVVSIAGVTGVASAALQQASQVFHVRLTRVPFNVPNTTIAGEGTATATLAGSTLTISGTFSDLKSPAIVAKLYDGQKKGLRGPALADLTISHDTKGTLQGSIQLTAGQIEHLKTDRLYIQIDSEGAPNGNLWGWLLPETNR